MDTVNRTRLLSPWNWSASDVAAFVQISRSTLMAAPLNDEVRFETNREAELIVFARFVILIIVLFVQIVAKVLWL